MTPCFIFNVRTLSLRRYGTRWLTRSKSDFDRKKGVRAFLALIAGFHGQLGHHDHDELEITVQLIRGDMETNRIVKRTVCYKEENGSITV